MSSSAASASTQLPSLEQIKDACAHIALRLGNYKYAVVGGAACQLLGSPRITAEVDLVVSKGAVSSARKLLATDQGRFTIEPRTLHTYYRSTPPVQIEILAPPSTFKEAFDETTQTMTVRVGGYSIAILHPILILNAKCRSVLGRAKQDKKQTDAYDIKYLLKYLAKTNVFPTSQNLTNASKAFVDWFIATYGDEDLWKNVNYDRNTGRPPFTARTALRN